VTISSTVEFLLKVAQPVNALRQVEKQSKKTAEAIKKNRTAFEALSKSAQKIQKSIEKSQGSFATGSRIQATFSARVLNTEKAMRAQIRALREVQSTVKFNGAIYTKAGAEIAKYEAILKSTNATAAKAKSANNGLGASLKQLAIGFGVARVGQQALQAGIQRDESERRLRLLTQRFGETAQAQEAAQRAAEKFNLSQTEANTQLSRLIARLRPMGLSMQTIETAFAGFNTATILAGATASESAGAFLQLSQALGSGVLRGQELNSILEQAPLIAQAIATEMGSTVGALKKFGEEGQITSEIVIAALGRVEREGAGQLEEALLGPAAAIKAFQNATEDVQVALTQDIIPEMAKSFRELAELIENLGPLMRLVGGGVGGAIGGVNRGIEESQALFRSLKEPGTVSARADIQEGRLPFNISGAAELIGKDRLQELRELADIAVQFGGRSEGPGSQRKVLLELLQKEIGMFGAPAPSAPDTTKPPAKTLTKPPGKERVDMSQKVFDLNKQLLDSDTDLTELQKINLEFQIEKQKILEKGFKPREHEIEMLRAAGGFEEDLLDYREDQLKLQEKANTLAERERKKREQEEKRRRESDPGFQMQEQLEKLLDVQNQVAAGATAIGNAFSNSFRAVITGSKSAQEALADMMSAVAEHFMDMAAKIIAQQLAMILYGTIMKALGVSMPGGGGGDGGSFAGVPNNVLDSVLKNKEGNYLSGGFQAFNQGGVVSKPTLGLVGEGGEPEYIIPQSKMRESMSRYSRGSRGGGVIPDNRGGSASEDGGVAVAAPIDVRYTVERINSVDYVTADQFQSGMQSAAAQGAQRGEQNTLKRLQMSGGTRKRLGL